MTGGGGWGQPQFPGDFIFWGWGFGVLLQIQTELPELEGAATLPRKQCVGQLRSLPQCPVPILVTGREDVMCRLVCRAELTMYGLEGSSEPDKPDLE